MRSITTLLAFLYFPYIAWALELISVPLGTGTTNCRNVAQSLPLAGWSHLSKVGEYTVCDSRKIERQSLISATVEARPGEGAPTESSFGYIVYSYADEDSIGIKLSGDTEKSFFCTRQTVGKGNCTQENIGTFLSTQHGKYPVQFGWHEAGREDTPAIQHANYSVTKTGLYCLRIVNPVSVPLMVSAKFQQPYGELHPDLYPLFKSTSILLISYLVGLVTWMALSLQYRKHLTSLQSYMGIVLLLFASEMIVTYSFYYNYNASGEASKSLMLLMMTLGAVRSTAVLFFLLLVSMGYGVVTANLGEKTKSIYILTTLHLFFSLFTNLSIITGIDRSSGMALLASIPISITFSILFSWILSSLTATKDSLAIRKQRTKLSMYQKLTFVLYTSFVLAGLCMLGAAVAILSRQGNPLDWYARNWNWLWFYSSGWSMLLNFGGCLFVGWIFRPQAYNRNYGLNELSSFPIDDEDLDNRASIALDTLRSTRNQDFEGPQFDAPITGHNQWATGTLRAFGDEDYEDTELAKKI